MGGTKKSLILVDLPKGLMVSCKNEPLKITEQTYDSEKSGNIVTLYKYPGLRLKMEKELVIELKSGDKTAVVPVPNHIKTTDVVIAVIADLFFTVGIGLVIDISDGALKTPYKKMIDVPAVLNKEEPRDQKALMKACWDAMKK